jgi:hypothetical protein
MRVFHFERPGTSPHVEPLCGDWGSMDADWTDVPASVTCVTCRSALLDAHLSPSPVADKEGNARPSA